MEVVKGILEKFFKFRSFQTSHRSKHCRRAALNNHENSTAKATEEISPKNNYFMINRFAFLLCFSRFRAKNKFFYSLRFLHRRRHETLFDV